jgi:hypothetical protein
MATKAEGSPLLAAASPVFVRGSRCAKPRQRNLTKRDERADGIAAQWPQAD